MTNWKKTSRRAGPEIFLRFETDLNFSRCRLKGWEIAHCRTYIQWACLMQYKFPFWIKTSPSYCSAVWHFLDPLQLMYWAAYLSEILDHNALMQLRCSKSVLVFDCWLMNHVIYFKLRQKKMMFKAEQIIIFLLKMARFEKKIMNSVNVVVILWTCSAFNKIYFCLSLR